LGGSSGNSGDGGINNLTHASRAVRANSSSSKSETSLAGHALCSGSRAGVATKRAASSARSIGGGWGTSGIISRSSIGSLALSSSAESADLASEQIVTSDTGVAGGSVSFATDTSRLCWVASSREDRCSEG